MYLKNAISQLLDCKQFSQPFALPSQTSSFSLFDAIDTKMPEAKKDVVEIIETSSFSLLDALDAKMSEPKKDVVEIIEYDKP
jgi:hypothetical protein